MTLMFKYSLLIIYILVLYGCRQDTSLKPTTQPVPDIDTMAFAEPDTEGLTKKAPQLTIPTNSRVAWQKPDLILQSFGSILQGTRIADIGAGPTGFFTFWLAQRGASVIAIDIDPSALAYIETEKTKIDTFVRPLIKTRLAKPQDPHLNPEEVDGILIVNTIAYISGKVKYLANLRNKLRTNGKLVIVDFKMKRLPEQIAPRKAERVHADMLEEYLYQSGYRNIVVDDQSLEYQYIITADK